MIDYEQVNPELGSWADVEALGRRFDLMFDFVANHCSAERPGSRRSCAPSPPTTATSSSRTPGRPARRHPPPHLAAAHPVETANGPVSVWTTFSADQVDLNYANPAVL